MPTPDARAAIVFYYRNPGRYAMNVLAGASISILARCMSLSRSELASLRAGLPDNDPPP